MNDEIKESNISSSDDSDVDSETSPNTKIAAKVTSKFKKKFPNFPPGYIYEGTSWGRDKMFPNVKFFNNDIKPLLMRGFKMSVNVTDEDMVQHGTAMETLIKNTLNAQRNYVTKKLKAYIRGKFFNALSYSQPFVI
jgi:hypothetical protein